MSNPRISVRAEELFTVTVGSRKSGAKNPGYKESLYIPLPREQVKALNLRKGEVLTLAILKRIDPVPNFPPVQEI